MPCPEQRAWGGVAKKTLLLTYGSKANFVYVFRGLLLPLFVLYTKWIYRSLARRVAAEINDYIKAGYSVVSVAGVDGSPSCGVNASLKLDMALEGIADIELGDLTSENSNRVVWDSLTPGEGMFTSALKAELNRHRRQAAEQRQHRANMIQRIHKLLGQVKDGVPADPTWPFTWNVDQLTTLGLGLKAQLASTS